MSNITYTTRNNNLIIKIQTEDLPESFRKTFNYIIKKVNQIQNELVLFKSLNLKLINYATVQNPFRYDKNIPDRLRAYLKHPYFDSYDHALYKICDELIEYMISEDLIEATLADILRTRNQFNGTFTVEK